VVENDVVVKLYQSTPSFLILPLSVPTNKVSLLGVTDPTIAIS